MTATRPSDAPYGPQDTGDGSEAGPEGDGPPQEPSAPCLFCQPGHKILCESARFYARFDNYPANPGHVEIVPRRHIESLWELSPDEVFEAWSLLVEARALLDAEYRPDGWTVGINEGRAAGRSVDHLHVHLIPRHHGDVPDPRGGIRRGLPNGNPDAWGAEPPQGDTALRERLVLALARTVYRDDNPPPHIVRICEPWADEIARDLDAWAAEQTQRAEQAERELDDARAAVAEARTALDRASTEMVGAQARLNESTVMHTENAKAITDLSAELDEARAAIARVRRLCEMTIASSCRVQAIDQARDTLAVLDRPEGT